MDQFKSNMEINGSNTLKLIWNEYGFSNRVFYATKTLYFHSFGRIPTLNPIQTLGRRSKYPVYFWYPYSDAYFLCHWYH